MGCCDSKQADDATEPTNKIEPTKRPGLYEKDLNYDEKLAQQEFGYSPDQMMYRRRIVHFYTRHNPQKLEEVDFLLHLFKDREQEVIDACVEKYGPEPEDSSADAGVGGGGRAESAQGGHRPAKRQGLSDGADDAPEEPQASEMPRQEAGEMSGREGLTPRQQQYQELSAVYSSPSFAPAAPSDRASNHV